MLNASAMHETTITFADFVAAHFHLTELGDGAEIEATSSEELAMDLLAGIESQVRSPDDWLRIAEAARDPALWAAVVALAEAKAAEARRAEAGRT